MTLARLATLGAILMTTALPAAAQEAFGLYARGPYRQGVPRPDAPLGYAAGARHTQHADQQKVLDALIAAAPDRARREVIGTTEEGRVMRVLIVTAPQNLARQDDIRADSHATTADAAAAIAGRIRPRWRTASSCSAITTRTSASPWIPCSARSGAEPRASSPTRCCSDGGGDLGRR